MTIGYAFPIQRLIKEFSRLPGVGEKTATRLATFVLRDAKEDAQRLADSIMEVKEKIRLCSRCYHLSEGELCAICVDARREADTICVVEDPDALVAIEKSDSFLGTYHVLHGTLSPLDGIGPEQLHLPQLVARVERDCVSEIIVATNPSVQGEATALLITRMMKGKGVRVSRIAMGVPLGGDLKYTDQMTLSKSMEFRREME
ncbi:MAG: recombination mediator RecR [Syntrophales bacterium]|jgi:recombination protein RecR|nr:recombination protein RecR [Deltaproteobacteria bacterium]